MTQKATLTALVQTGSATQPAVYGVFQATIHRPKRGEPHARLGTKIAVYRVPHGTPVDYLDLARKHATPDYPAVKW